MRKIKFEDPPTLKDPSAWDSSFVDFIKYCLVKDSKSRPNAEMVLKNNKRFLSKAKNNAYLKMTMLKGVPTVHKRVYIKIYKYIFKNSLDLLLMILISKKKIVWKKMRTILSIN
jgi:hypothetical protein